MSKKLEEHKFISRKEVAYHFPLTVRFLEECASKTRVTGELVGPPFFQIENTVKYKTQHIIEYIEKTEVNPNTAKDLEAKCLKNKEICKKYYLKKIIKKKSPHIPHVPKKKDINVENKNKKII